MFLSWFDTKEVDALADQLVRELVESVPPKHSDGATGKQDAKLRKVHDRILRQAQQFAQEHPLNVYKKARLANRFKWGLLDAQYPQWFVTEVTYELAALVSSRAQPS